MVSHAAPMVKVGSVMHSAHPIGPAALAGSTRQWAGFRRVFAFHHHNKYAINFSHRKTSAKKYQQEYASLIH